MSPAAQQAFDAWYAVEGDTFPSYDWAAKKAFEAGYNAAARLLLPVIDSSLQEPLGDAGRGNTPAEPQKPAIEEETASVGLSWDDQIALEKAGLIGYDAQMAWVGPEPERKSPHPEWAVPAVTAEDVYKAYPRKVGKRKAIEAISKAAKLVGPKPSSTTRWCPYELLLERTKAYAEATAKWPQEDKQYIPFPATFYNQGRYEDDPKEWERGVVASQFLTTH